MARKPERNHGAYKESGFLKTKSKLVFYGPAEVAQALTKIKVTKDEGNIKLLLRRNSLSFFLKDA